MSQRLFDKAIIFTDIHWGKSNNDKDHNRDCMEFCRWMVDVAKERDIDTCFFLGDWHDTRHTIHVSTLHWSHEGLELLNKSFKTTYFLIGNHDLFYKDRRDVTSVVIADKFPNIHLVKEIEVHGETVLVPWLVNDEWEYLNELTNGMKYVFGHFELPFFMMNAQVEMPDHGKLNDAHFKGVHGYVFSGHFHKRQKKGNVIYIGNCFPHNFSDTWDDERGCVVLEWDSEPEFISWPEAPKYRKFDLSEMLESPYDVWDSKMSAKIILDIKLTFEEQLFIKDVFASRFGARKIELIAANKPEDTVEEIDNKIFQSIDDIVREGLRNLDSNVVDPELLIEIYEGLE